MLMLWTRLLCTHVHKVSRAWVGFLTACHRDNPLLGKYFTALVQPCVALKKVLLCYHLEGLQQFMVHVNKLNSHQYANNYMSALCACMSCKLGIETQNLRAAQLMATGLVCKS